MSNFAFLHPREWAFLFEPAKKAEGLAKRFDSLFSCLQHRAFRGDL